MRSFETSGLFCCGRNRESLRLNLSASGRVLALGLGVGLGLGLVIPQAAWAACVATPDCESLGYTETSCTNGGVKCPWNTSKLFCGGCGGDYVYSCIGTGYSGGAGIGCNGKYTKCNCASGYDWNGSSCIACDSAYQYTCTGTGYLGGSSTACGGIYMSCACDAGFEWSGSECGKICEVGDILNSDKICTSEKVSGKTPIGVVSYINGSTRLAIQLDNPGYMEWGCYKTDIRGIPNSTDSAVVLYDFNGKSHTSAWMSGCNAGTSYAAGYCNSYSKGGVSGWYLPAAGELYASVWTNKTAVNAGLSKAGGMVIVENSHWSSSEYNTGYAWFVSATDAYVDNRSKSITFPHFYVRCVLAF